MPLTGKNPTRQQRSGCELSEVFQYRVANERQARSKLLYREGQGTTSIKEASVQLQRAVSELLLGDGLKSSRVEEDDAATADLDQAVCPELTEDRCGRFPIGSDQLG